VALLASAALLAPVVVPAMARLLGAPLGLMWVPGRLGRGNAARDPRRTAATAAALMIGLALISVAGVFAASAKATLTEQVDSRLRGDVIVSPDEPLESVPASVADRIAQRDDVAEVGVASFAEWSDGDNVREVAVVDPVVFDRVYDAQETEGALTDLEPGGVVLDEDLAGDLGVGVGDRVPMLFESGQASMRVDALMSDQILGEALIHSADQGGLPVRPSPSS
jgi:putative ABC transport system permease protein